MSDQQGNDSLPPAVLKRVDETRDRFESALRVDLVERWEHGVPEKRGTLEDYATVSLEEGRSNDLVMSVFCGAD